MSLFHKSIENLSLNKNYLEFKDLNFYPIHFLCSVDNKSSYIQTKCELYILILFRPFFKLL